MSLLATSGAKNVMINNHRFTNSLQISERELGAHTSPVKEIESVTLDETNYDDMGS